MRAYYNDREVYGWRKALVLASSTFLIWIVPAIIIAALITILWVIL